MTDFTPPRRLTAEDDADGFDCGLPVVNDWLRNQLRNAGKQHTAVADDLRREYRCRLAAARTPAERDRIVT